MVESSHAGSQEADREVDKGYSSIQCQTFSSQEISSEICVDLLLLLDTHMRSTPSKTNICMDNYFRLATLDLATL